MLKIEKMKILSRVDFLAIAIFNSYNIHQREYLRDLVFKSRENCIVTDV